MIKKLLVVAVLLGAAWSFPASRARMVQLGEPLLVRMGPVGQRVLNPVRRYNTAQEIELLVRELGHDHTARNPLPNPRNFQAWVEANATSGRDGRDAWGNPYYLRRDRQGLTVGSAGEDGAMETADDITRHLPL